MLLLGFVALITGVATWLTISASPADYTAEVPTKIKSSTAKQRHTGKPTINPTEGPTAKISDKHEKGTSKPTDGAAKGKKTLVRGDNATYRLPTTKKRNTADLTAGKSPVQSANAAQKIAPKSFPGQRAANNQPEPLALAHEVMPKKSRPLHWDLSLSPSPDPALIQMTALGALPRVGNDGRLPREVYAKPFNTGGKRPRIAIVMTGLGLSAAATESAIQGLPGSVTLAFAPHSPRLNEWILLARAAGHEVLLNIPMEPTNYPSYNPGTQTLLTTLSGEENISRLLWSLSRGSGYVGVIDFLGSQFTTSKDHMIPVLKVINRRGLLYLDSNSSPRSVSVAVAAKLNLVMAKATLTLDERASRKEIDRRLADLEQRAKRERRAIGIASPYPVSLERVAIWVSQLEARGISIAPVSALALIPASSKTVP